MQVPLPPKPIEPAESPGESPPTESIDESEPLRPDPIAEQSAAEESAADDLSSLYDIREDPSPPKPARKIPLTAVSADASAENPQPISPPRDPTVSIYNAISKPKTYAADSAGEKSGLIKLVVIVCLLGAAIAGAFYGIRIMGGSNRETGPQLGEDADIRAKIQDEYNKEVHAWFAEDHDRIMGPWSESQAISHADRWKEMGAKQVLAFSTRMSQDAVIELPDDPAQRKALFDWQAKWHTDHREKVWTDVGQKYLMIRLGV